MTSMCLGHLDLSTAGQRFQFFLLYVRRVFIVNIVFIDKANRAGLPSQCCDGKVLFKDLKFYFLIFILKMHLAPVAPQDNPSSH